jgi:uncharacterized protein
MEVTPERLNRVERAEDYLRNHGFENCRVRMHPDDLGRIEVPQDRISELIKLDRAGNLTEYFVELGFKFVSVDLAGFRSGSMNRVLVNIDQPSADRQQFAGGRVDRNQGALD